MRREVMPTPPRFRDTGYRDQWGNQIVLGGYSWPLDTPVCAIRTKYGA